MNKCDFCTKSNPKGKCFWTSQPLREDDCRKAIKAMVETLKETPKENKR